MWSGSASWSSTTLVVVNEVPSPSLPTITTRPLALIVAVAVPRLVGRGFPPTVAIGGGMVIVHRPAMGHALPALGRQEERASTDSTVKESSSEK